jgi:hypothetical protein
VGIVGLRYVEFHWPVELAKRKACDLLRQILASRRKMLPGYVNVNFCVQDDAVINSQPAGRRYKIPGDNRIFRRRKPGTIKIVVPILLRKTKGPEMSYLVCLAKGGQVRRAAADFGIDHSSRYNG